MDFSKKYEELAKQLGDVDYKLHVLNEKRAELLENIKRLDEFVGLVNAQKNQAQNNPNGSGSPA